MSDDNNYSLPGMPKPQPEEDWPIIKPVPQAQNAPGTGAKTASADPLESVKSLKDNGEDQNFISASASPVCTPIYSKENKENLANLMTELESLSDLNAEPEMFPNDGDLPRDPPPNPPGRMGTCGATMQRRLPTKDEFIDENGTIMPLGFWRAPKPKPKRRKLGSLNSLADVQRELAKIYADHHHHRIETTKYVRGVYGLRQLALVMKMEQCFDYNYAKKLRDVIRN